MKREYGTLIELQQSVGNSVLSELVLRVEDPDHLLVVQREELPWTEIQQAGEDAEALYAKARKLYQLPEKLEKAAAALRKIRGARAKDMPVIVSSLLSASDGIVNVAKVYDQFTGHLRTLPLSQASAIIGKTNKAAKALALVVALVDDSKLKDFEDNPSLETAYAWADDAADTFTRASALVPENLVFVGPMLKGTLSAPANYLRASRSILDARLRRIDQASGSSASERVSEGIGDPWEGPLSRVYFEAYLRADGLRQFMQDHRRESGIDLFTTSRDFGIAHLLNLVHTCAPERTDWVNYLGGWL